MKKTIIALMALAGVAMAADVSLSTQVQKANGTNIDLYNSWETYKADTSVVEAIGHKNAVTLTFYVKVSDLYGADGLDTTASYILNSFSYLGWDDDGELGQGETLTVSLGTQSVTSTISDSHKTGSYDPQNTVTFGANQVLTFTSADILTITLKGGKNASGNDTNVGIKYVDTLGTNKLLGSASNLSDDGTMNYWHEDKANGKNAWQTGWKTDAPIINLTATKVVTIAVPEPTTATLSLLALAGLAARRRRK